MNAPSPTDPTAGELLAIAGGGWGYAEAAWIDGWHARASGGFTHRANSAWPIAVPDLVRRPDLLHTLDALREWYAARSLPALVQCVAGSQLDHALAACGHDRVEQAAIRQNARVATVLEALARRAGETGPSTGTVCELADRPGPGWLGVYRSGTLPPIAGQVLGAGNPDIRFATVADEQDGRVLAIGRAALAAAPGGAGPAGWAGLAGIEVVPDARRRGLATLIIRELIRWAAGRGVSELFLEVGSGNAAALELYRTLGFSTHHAYHYRVIESRLD